ncbi:2-amino-thiazoline-4-carboxylic acid hydrolase [Kaistia algarum]|uniref:L-2-amino-thiazoline-4-carboxylic acid hydrolase n=1 Tax=Kaistia algarum TaxID=2083279 RepID=UPI000CE77B97|nr:L-2-amino-thiazoline-4-carboxylic acid hydrolase [Kaistia algarum]MCX5512643.1 L-2-amino-thiazoline-4-carboxylic acid hydrolase [Kaistia algarum]PPE81843.1 2-amino-thiazoline-4-carboxylic acid hydrolase [Kaistia algarum]
MSDWQKNNPGGTVEAAIDGLGILARRRIEAEIIKPIYEEMVARFGREAAREALKAAITRAAIESGKRFAAAQNGPVDLVSFAALQPKWRQDDALHIEVLSETPERFDYDVTRCRYAEMYHAMGLGEIGDILSCQRDGTFCQGYDPRIQMTRTTTIMSGAKRCDFRYSMRDEVG